MKDYSNLSVARSKPGNKYLSVLLKNNVPDL